MVSFIDRFIYGLIWLPKRKRRELNTALTAMNAVLRLPSSPQGKADGLATAPAAVRCALATILTSWRD